MGFLASYVTASSCVPWKGTESKGTGRGQALVIIQVCVCVGPLSGVLERISLKGSNYYSKPGPF